MSRILAPDQTFMLKCKCGSSIFQVVVAGNGVTCTCAKCMTKYKLESLGGVKVANA